VGEEKVAGAVEALVEQWRSVWGRLGTAKQIALIGVTLGALGGLFLLLIWGEQPSYRVLYANLSREDAARIVEHLKTAKVEYRLTDGGTIEVPESELYDLRLTLATKGLPQGGGVGFELFDRNSFGATEFVQRVNLQRALQGELARTIRQYPQVSQARVHLTLPERSLFVREEAGPKATVVLQLKPGAILQPVQLQGIVHLVASSVQEMQPQDVHVTDTKGKVLYSPKDGESYEGITSSILEVQHKMEERLEEKIKGILEPIVGPDKVAARVHLDLDPRRVEQTEEQYDPDKAAVRSEQRTTEKSNGGGAYTGGVPGVLSNTPGEGEPGVAAKEAGSSFNRSNETVNYELNHLTRRTVSPMGQVRRLTVAVLVDGIRQKVAGDSGKEVWKVVPRPAEEIKQYEAIVKQAVGFNPERGDQLQVASAPFETTGEEQEAQPVGWGQRIAYWSWPTIARYGVILFLGFLLLFLVVRPLIKGILSAMQQASFPAQGGELPGPLGDVALGELESESGDPTQARKSLQSAKQMSEEVGRIAKAEPERFAAALRAWLRQE
jgi:flagellar M-ring protein FliF